VLQRVIVLTVVAIAAIASPAKEKPAGKPGDTLAPLWTEPKDLESRDLFYGVGGKAKAPTPGGAYRYEKSDTTGHSKGYYVFGEDGRKWRIKIGSEAQSEIVVSRLLWAIGYHQPALYYLADWKLTGTDSGDDEMKPGRFRLISEHETEGEWSFRENPFLGTRELRGLIAANLLLNNWDLDESNNRIYRVERKGGGAELRYVCQDVGGSLGKTRLPVGSRNKIVDFESQDYVLGVEDGRVLFDYHGRHGATVRMVTPEDVVWACRLFSRLSDKQLRDAFRAAEYPDDVAARYITKIRDKIRQGLALGTSR